MITTLEVINITTDSIASRSTPILRKSNHRCRLTPRPANLQAAIEDPVVPDTHPMNPHRPSWRRVHLPVRDTMYGLGSVPAEHEWSSAGPADRTWLFACGPRRTLPSSTRLMRVRRPNIFHRFSSRLSPAFVLFTRSAPRRNIRGWRPWPALRRRNPWCGISTSATRRTPPTPTAFGRLFGQVGHLSIRPLVPPL